VLIITPLRLSLPQELEQQASQTAQSLRQLALRQQDTLAGVVAASATGPLEDQMRQLREENAALQVCVAGGGRRQGGVGQGCRQEGSMCSPHSI
jgi:hypothetical protein